MLRKLAVFAAFAATLIVGSDIASAGNLKGKFVYDGKAPAPAKLTINKDPEVCAVFNLVDESLLVDANGGLANVVIYCRTPSMTITPEMQELAKQQVVLDNKNCQFVPHIALVWLPQTLVIGNADPVAHNSNMQPLADLGINPLIAAGSKVEHTFRRSQTIPQPVTCNIHPWMKAYVLPRDNPYMAVSAADGTFEITGLPAGEFEFGTWHEKAGYLTVNDWASGRFKKTIPATGDVDIGVIKVPPALLSK